MTKKLSRRLLTGGLAIVASLTLVACGKQAAVSSTSSTSSKATAESPSAKAYREAQKLIKEGRFQTAIDRLDDVHNPSSQVKALKVDLQKYVQAQKSYDKQDYQKTVSTLSQRQSNNQRLNSAMDNLSARAAGAANGGQVSTKKQNSTAAQANSSSATSASSSSSQTDQTPVDQSVVDFATKMGFTGSDYQIITQSDNGENFRFEVRRNNADNTVANMVGIYSYNSNTGAVTKID